MSPWVHESDKSSLKSIRRIISDYHCVYGVHRRVKHINYNKPIVSLENQTPSSFIFLINFELRQNYQSYLNYQKRTNILIWNTSQYLKRNLLKVN